MKTTKALGWILVTNELICLIISLIVQYFASYIQISSKLNGEYFPGNIPMDINPSIDFSLSYTLLGVSFIVLSSLFMKGNQFRQEQELTI